MLGDLIRLSPELRDEIRADPSTAYDRATSFDGPERLELDWEWKLFGPLFTAAGFRVNPFRSGSPGVPFSGALSLEPNEVAEAAATLEKTPFAVHVPHLRGALVERDTVRVDHDYESPVVTPTFPDDEVESYRSRLAPRYDDLTAFYRTAADHGECTVFWAA
ncbi:DUF1877 family protein [Paractinoplanes bogorensis]|nr:DUF1877 family protein [Actinoplanes bogorensis]